MLINIVCIESSRPDWSKQAFESYQSKFNKSINIQWKGCKPVQRNKSYDIDKAIKKESELLLAKTKLKHIYEHYGPVRYATMMLFGLTMFALPIKMYLRWTINLKYIIAIPEWFFNI